MTSPIEYLASLHIGTVESVSPREITVLLDLEAPHATALNTGTPTLFPRINGYVVVPNQGGAIIGLVSWIGIEKSPFPKRKGFTDFGLIDLPYPLRKMKIAPIGMLLGEQKKSATRFKLSRGVTTFPSVGDRVLLPTPEQVRSVVEATGTDRRVKIGTCPSADDAEIFVDPDKLFGRHLAVLGNTGSGKSCTVAGVIRWSLESARRARREGNQPADRAKFIVLDPNGEYSRCFQDLGSRVLRVEAQMADGSDQLEFPIWLWNSYEWSAFTRAAPGMQRPTLQRALRQLRLGSPITDNSVQGVRLIIASYLTSLRGDKLALGSALAKFPGNRDFCLRLEVMARTIRTLAEGGGVTITNELLAFAVQIEQLEARLHTVTEKGYHNFAPVDLASIEVLEATIQSLLTQIGFIEEPSSQIGEDSPLPFDAKQLAPMIEELAQLGRGAEHVDTLTLRIRTLLSDQGLHPVLTPERESRLLEYLESFLGTRDADDPPVLVVDLSIVPSSVIHTLVAVIARFTFEALQRYKRHYRQELPTTLVLEEAHTFVTRGKQTEDSTPDPEQMCRSVFERIAREGRKFGLGLVLSSQRPSELSPTVLAQCNTFVLHRIVNDRDQELIAKLIPDSLSGMLHELPILPQRTALLLGQATVLPVQFEVSSIPPEFRPESADPQFWDFWVGETERQTDWAPIADAWQGVQLLEDKKEGVQDDEER